MERIKLHDKWFKVCTPADQLDAAVSRVAEQLNKDLKDVKEPVFLSILNGSFMFTSDLMKKLDIVADLMFVKLSSYCGTSSTGKVQQVMGLNRSIEGKTVIVVEDIVETGNTIVELHKMLKEAGAADIKICTLLLKPNAYKKDIKIDYAALTIPDDFIVGYGLDYNNLGRQYKDLYVLDNQ